MLHVINDYFCISIGPLGRVRISGDFLLKINKLNCLLPYCQECYSLFYAHSVVTHGVVYYVHTKELGLSF